MNKFYVMIRYFLIPGICVFLIHYYSQGQILRSPVIPYFINPSVHDTVMSQVRHYGIDDPGVGVMYVKVWRNDTVRWNNFDNSLTGNNKGSQFLGLSCVTDDTIRIMSSFGNRGEAGFYLEIFNDSCRIRYLPYDTWCHSQIIMKDGSRLSRLIPCVQTKLTLFQRPRGTIGEVIEGIIELTSAEFILSGDWCNEGTGRGQLKAYFIAVPNDPVHNSMNMGKIIGRISHYDWELNSYVHD